MEAPPSPLSSRPERSAVERSAVFHPRTAVAGHNRRSPLSSRPEKLWAFGPPKVMKNRLLFGNHTYRQPHLMKAPPSPLSSRPERSVVERSAVFHPGQLLRATTASPLCHLDRRSY